MQNKWQSNTITTFDFCLTGKFSVVTWVRQGAQKWTCEIIFFLSSKQSPITDSVTEEGEVYHKIHDILLFTAQNMVTTLWSTKSGSLFLTTIQPNLNSLKQFLHCSNQEHEFHTYWYSNKFRLALHVYARYLLKCNAEHQQRKREVI